MAVWSAVPISTVLECNRLDAEFFQPEFLKVGRNLQQVGAASLESLLSDVRYGLNIPPDYVEEGLPFLRALNLKEYGISGEILHIPLTASQVGNINILADGDLLIVRSGANVGDTGIVTSRFVGSTFGSYVIRMRFREIDPYYLYVFLKSYYGRVQTVRFRSGSAQPNISIPNLKEILVLVPPRSDQRTIRRFFEKSEAATIKAEEFMIAAENELLSAVGLASLSAHDSLSYERPFAELRASQRFDAEYFSPRHQQVFEILGKGRKTIGDIANIAERRFRPERYKPDDKFHYIEIGSLDGMGLTDAEAMDVIDAPSRAQWLVEPGDVITSTVRPIRRLSALITPEQSGYVCSSGFAVLRPKEGPDGIEPEVLLTFLRLPIICELLDLHTTASMYPAISTTRLLEIPVAVPKQSIRDKVVSKVRSSLNARTEAARLLEEAKEEVERLMQGNVK